MDGGEGVKGELSASKGLGVAFIYRKRERVHIITANDAEDGRHMGVFIKK